jgi:hypothetical protein
MCLCCDLRKTAGRLLCCFEDRDGLQIDHGTMTPAELSRARGPVQAPQHSCQPPRETRAPRTIVSIFVPVITLSSLLSVSVHCRLAIHFATCRPTSRETATSHPTATRMVPFMMYPPSHPQLRRPLRQRPCPSMWRMSCIPTSVLSHPETLSFRLTLTDRSQYPIEPSQAEHCILARTINPTTHTC